MNNNQLTLAAVSAAIFAIVWILHTISIFPELPWAGGVVGGLAWFAAAFAWRTYATIRSDRLSFGS